MECEYKMKEKEFNLSDRMLKVKKYCNANYLLEEDVKEFIRRLKEEIDKEVRFRLDIKPETNRHFDKMGNAIKEKIKQLAGKELNRSEGE